MENAVDYTYEEEVWNELIDGSIVAMSPRPNVNHNFASGNIFGLFHSYLKGRKCTPFADGVDLFLTERDRFVPDGMVVCDPEKIKADGVHGAPDLVVEVLSPSTARYDKGYKRRVYGQCGVREYWLVNPGDKSIDIYLLEDGQLQFKDSILVYPDFELERLTPEEREAVPTSFQCSIFPDLTVTLEDVFDRVK